MEDCDVVARDEFAKLIGQDFGCRWLPTHFIKDSLKPGFHRQVSLDQIPKLTFTECKVVTDAVLQLGQKAPMIEGGVTDQVTGQRLKEQQSHRALTIRNCSIEHQPTKPIPATSGWQCPQRTPLTHTFHSLSKVTILEGCTESVACYPCRRFPLNVVSPGFSKSRHISEASPCLLARRRCDSLSTFELLPTSSPSPVQGSAARNRARLSVH